MERRRRMRKKNQDRLRDSSTSITEEDVVTSEALVSSWSDPIPCFTLKPRPRPPLVTESYVYITAPPRLTVCNQENTKGSRLLSVNRNLHKTQDHWTCYMAHQGRLRESSQGSRQENNNDAPALHLFPFISASLLVMGTFITTPCSLIPLGICIGCCCCCAKLTPSPFTPFLYLHSLPPSSSLSLPTQCN